MNLTTVASLRSFLIFKSQGFRKVFNIAGGINEYAVKVDPSIPTYWSWFSSSSHYLLLLDPLRQRSRSFPLVLELFLLSTHLVTELSWSPHHFVFDCPTIFAQTDSFSRDNRQIFLENSDRRVGFGTLMSGHIFLHYQTLNHAICNDFILNCIFCYNFL